MFGRCLPIGAVIAAVLPFAVASVVLAKTPSASLQNAHIAGVYDGSQSEMAVGLELREDGRFRYGLSYGALDEQAQGTWISEGGQILLTSDPFVPPNFLLLGRDNAPVGRLRITLDLPNAMSRQYFQVELRLANGTVVDHQFSEQESLEIDPREQPVSLAVTLPLFGLHSETVELPRGRGSEIRFRFEPNALGKVAFSKTALRKDHGALILIRHDRTIRFIKP